MGQGKDDKKGRSVANAAVATASVALGYAALELGLGGVLKPGREAIQHSLEPQEEQAATSEFVEGKDHDAQVQVQGNTTTQAPVEEKPDTAASVPQHAATAASSPIEQEEQKQR